MTPGEAVYRLLAGGKDAGTEIGSAAASERLLMAQYGSVAGISRATGVPASTLRGWFAGRTPKGGRDRGLIGHAQQLQRQIRMRGRRAARLSKPGALSDLTVRGRLRYSDRSTPKGEGGRSVNLGQYLSDDVGEALVDAYLAGASTDELGAILAEAVEGADFYQASLAGDSSVGWDLTSIAGGHGGWAEEED